MNTTERGDGITSLTTHNVRAGAKIPIMPFEIPHPIGRVARPQLWEPEEGGRLFRGKNVEEISELRREGFSIQAISQLTGFDRKTIRKYLLKPEGRPVYEPRQAPVSKLEPFKPYLKEYQ